MVMKSMQCCTKLEGQYDETLVFILNIWKCSWDGLLAMYMLENKYEMRFLFVDDNCNGILIRGSIEINVSLMNQLCINQLLERDVAHV